MANMKSLVVTILLIIQCFRIARSQWIKQEWPDGNRYYAPGDYDTDTTTSASTSNYGGHSAVTTEAQKGVDAYIHSLAEGDRIHLPNDYRVALMNASELSRVDRAATLSALLNRMPLNKMARLPWSRLIADVPADTFNTMTPERLQAIDWTQAMPKLTPEQAADLQPSTVANIPPDDFGRLTQDAFVSMSAITLSQLSVPHMKNVPESHWNALSVDKIYAVDRNKLAAVSGDLLLRSYRLAKSTHGNDSSMATGDIVLGLTLGEYQTYLNNHRNTTRYQPILPTVISRRIFFW